MSTVLITGANRGIGLAFVQSFAVDGWCVHACCRRPDKAHALKAVEGEVVRHRLDVTDDFRMESLARELADEPIDVLINNAGVYGPRHNFGETDYEAWARVFQINTMAPLQMVECFVDHVAQSERRLIVNISSDLGSISMNDSGGNHIYRSSKSALNMITKGLAHELVKHKVGIIAFHPGWVQTDMGGPDAETPAEESVAGIRNVIDRFEHSHSGKFFTHDGEEIPW